MWNGPADGIVRLYFHSDLAKTEHYIEMIAAPNGRHWAMLPKPTDQVSEIAYRIVVVDGKASSKSVGEGQLSVLPACPASPLTEEESKFAKSLVIGSDVEGPQKPVGFLCDGIVGRITRNLLQAYNACAEEALVQAVARRTLLGAPPAQKLVVSKTSASESLQGLGTKIGGLPIGPLHHRTPRRAPLPPTPPQPRLSEPVSPSRP